MAGREVGRRHRNTEDGRFNGEGHKGLGIHYMQCIIKVEDLFEKNEGKQSQGVKDMATLMHFHFARLLLNLKH